MGKIIFYTNLNADKRTRTPEENRFLKSSLFIVSLFKTMITMNVNIQAVHFDADSRLIEYVNQKLQKLNNFSDRIIRVNVFLKLDNVMHAVKDKIAEIRIHVPRHNFFVKSTSKSFEESFDDAFDSIVTQIKRNKERKAA